MPDLSDAFAWIRGLIRRVDRLESGALLENASITSGRLRFIGGLLRVDSGGRVEIVGTLQVDGTSTVTGSFTVEGPWELTGDGTITGAVNITGPFTLEGSWTITGDGSITGATTVSGPLTVEGDFDMTGNMRVTGDVEVLDDGRVRVGNMTLDPSTNGGSVKFSGGPEVYASGGQLALYSNAFGAWIELGSTAKLANGVRAVEITGSNIKLQGLPTIAQSDVPGSFVGALIADGSGNVSRVVSG